MGIDLAPGHEPTGSMDATTRVEIRLEASTMALYVSVVLLAALVAIKNSAASGDPKLLELIWGTTLGLALAHFFAFRMSSRLIRGTAFHRGDLQIALAQFGGAAAVAVLCTIPVVALPTSSEDDVVRLLLGLLLGITGYASGRTGGASRVRSLATGALTLVIGIAVALVKNGLGH